MAPGRSHQTKKGTELGDKVSCGFRGNGRECGRARLILGISTQEPSLIGGRQWGGGEEEGRGESPGDRHVGDSCRSQRGAGAGNGGEESLEENPAGTTGRAVPRVPTWAFCPTSQCRNLSFQGSYLPISYLPAVPA